LPNKRGVTPGYEHKFFSEQEKQDQLSLLLSPDGREGSISAHTEALMYGVVLSDSKQISYSINPDRVIYAHIAKGEAVINGESVSAGDGITVVQEASIELTGKNMAEVLLFDLPAKPL
jgi:quercetin 2,3-dioxygenase